MTPLLLFYGGYHSVRLVPLKGPGSAGRLRAREDISQLQLSILEREREGGKGKIADEASEAAAGVVDAVAETIVALVLADLLVAVVGANIAALVEKVAVALGDASSAGFESYSDVSRLQTASFSRLLRSARDFRLPSMGTAAARLAKRAAATMVNLILTELQD